jgi:DNA recombination protein RmuC
MRQRVLIASPVNLLALLLAVAKGWQAHKATEHADEVARLGAEVYDRVGKVLELVSKMGKGIESSTRAYNDLVGSIESRMLVTLRKFRELGVVQTEIDEVKQIEVATRELSAVEVPRELD